MSRQALRKAVPAGPLRLVHEMSLALNVSLGKKPSFREALGRLLEGVGGTAAVLLAVPPGAPFLEVVEGAGRLTPGPLDASRLNRFFQEAASSVDLITGDLAKELGYHREIASSGLLPRGSAAAADYVMVTLKSRRRPVGLLFLGLHPGETLSDEGALLLSTLGFQLGAALENSWLFEEVNRAREAWQATFDAMEEIIVITDDSGRFLQANRAFLRYLEEEGRRDDLTEAKARFFREVLAPSGLYPPAALFGPSRVEVEAGERAWSISAFPVGENPGTWVYVVGDITLKRRLRELEDLNRQLAELYRVRGSIVARVSHDLRTPLNAVIGFSEVLLGGDFGGLNQKQERYLKKINEAGRHLLGLINDMLDLGRLEAGKLELRLGPVEVGAVAEATLLLFEEEARAREVVLSCERPNLPLEVRADERRLRQVLFNLLSNAVKFAGSGGLAGVKVGRTEEGALVEVWDTGMGIPVEKHHLIFEEFTGTGAPGGQGAGLGLAISRQLVELHGGRIWVKSAEGRGTSFFFTLPAAGPRDRG